MEITVASWFDRATLAKAKRIVGISTSEPKGAKLHTTIIEFVPMIQWVRDVKNNRITEDQYTALYLDAVFPRLDSAIEKLQDGDVLCCWCKKGKFCHRQIVAELLTERGIKVNIL